MYLEYARKIEPEISPEARSMIAQYYINLDISNINLKSKRVLETLFRLSKAHAKIRLKKMVESEDVAHITKFYNILINCYLPSLAVIPQDRLVRLVERCRSILEEKGSQCYSPRSYRTCYDNEYIRSYVTGSQLEKIEEYHLTPEKNKKIRNIRKLLINDENTMVINKTPLKLQHKQDSLTTGLTPSPTTSASSERSD